ncbi:6-phosphofructo-2-kinase/fructose-2,6-bisphosphatase-like isoform X1 [Episyrphus balteatus]|uniref:6-phosphofructo-2-kinase/fructose-2, 6-bisphosphatase-like isoform X1 n=1 Tax=Episyrphus balteatus TaxID=286459 RepID=UPI002484DDAC|nr:6-phosphofructo-2-kinase/fructose-2,6-bisphosphatase-like isoform X1 [Episyrphus balteatus]
MAPIAVYGKVNNIATNSINMNEMEEAAVPVGNINGQNGFKSDLGVGNFVKTVTPCPLRAPLVVSIVGLPCRGKSFAAHKIARHLSWKGELAKVFPVEQNATSETLNDISNWFLDGNNVAIIDGMHLSRQSRQLVSNFCNDRIYHHLIVEIDCDDKSLESNIKEMVRYFERTNNRSIDWKKIFIEKVRDCTPLFEKCLPLESPLITVNNSENPYLHSVMSRGVQGALQTSILGVLSHPVIREQLFYFSRHGESDYNVVGRIGGNADLSSRGWKYAERLTRLFKENQLTLPGPQLIWTSEFIRTIHTVRDIPGPRAAVNDLNEINAGICEGLTYEEIQEKFPQEFAWRDQDKFKYRYPHGESYLDLLQRVDSVIQGLLTKTQVLVVSHQAVLRCVMAYFNGTKPDQVPYINVPLHTLLVVRTNGFNFEVEEIPLHVECVDTYRVKPKNCNIERTSSDALGTVPAHFDAPLPKVTQGLTSR